MVQKPEIRTWHREEFAAGKLDNIPKEVIAKLEAEKAEAKEAKKEHKKDKAE